MIAQEIFDSGIFPGEVYMYVCMYVCMCTCMCVWMERARYVCEYEYIYVCMHVSVYV